MAVQEVDREPYILSAVMHVDERNKSLSEELVRDVSACGVYPGCEEGGQVDCAL